MAMGMCFCRRGRRGFSACPRPLANYQVHQGSRSLHFCGTDVMYGLRNNDFSSPTLISLQTRLNDQLPTAETNPMLPIGIVPWEHQLCTQLMTQDHSKWLCYHWNRHSEYGCPFPAHRASTKTTIQKRTESHFHHHGIPRSVLLTKGIVSQEMRWDNGLTSMEFTVLPVLGLTE